MTDSSIYIRPAGSDDKEALADIISTSYRDVAVRFELTAENCPKHPSNCTLCWIEGDVDRGAKYYLLMAQDKPIGCVAVEMADQEVAYLERLAVLPEYRGQEYGTQLARHAMDLAQKEGAARMSIGIIAAQTELKQWYGSLGFNEGETRDFDHLPFMVTFMSYTFP